MKKLTIIALVLAMCLSVGSCGKNDTGNNNPAENGVTEQVTDKSKTLLHLDSNGEYKFDKYDSEGRLVRHITFDSEAESTYSSKYEYDDKDRLVKSVEGSHICEYTYDDKDNLVKSKIGNETTEYVYDDNGNPVTETTKGSTYTITKENTFDENGNKIKCTWEENNGLSKAVTIGETDYTYDSDGNLTYEKSHSVIEEQMHRIENTEEYTYTYEKGNLTLKEGFLEAVNTKTGESKKVEVYNRFEYEYYDSGKIKTKAEFGERDEPVSKEEYDEDGKIIRSSIWGDYMNTGLRIRIETVYDSAGNAIYSTVYTGNGTVIGYDSDIKNEEIIDGNKVVTFSDGTVATYNADGNEIRRDYYKPNGNLDKRYIYEYKEGVLVKYTTYDSNENPSNSIECDPTSFTVKCTKYNNDGSTGKMLEYKYNSNIQMIEETMHQNGEFKYRYTYAYDERGKRTERISYDENGNVIE
ncbi:MAG: hypothetical protein E7578_06295 [Ruminococcaceae bacterium]|nr:hypothetical protein [Oscillospiraceae bacterium]